MTSTAEIFISHSLNKHFAKLLGLKTRENLPANVEPFVDSLDLQTGKLWRPEIFRRLHTCCGGVIILTPESAKSHWVQFEVNILLWRHAMEQKFEEQKFKFLRIDVTPDGKKLTKEDLIHFEPVQLREFQEHDPIQLNLPTREMSKDEVIRDYQDAANALANELSKIISDHFKNIVVVRRPKYLQQWFEMIHSRIKTAIDAPTFLDDALQALRMPPSNQHPAQEQPIADLATQTAVLEMPPEKKLEAIADGFISAPPRNAIKAFQLISQCIDSAATKKALLKYVGLTLVSAKTAIRIKEACNHSNPSERTVFILSVMSPSGALIKDMVERYFLRAHGVAEKIEILQLNGVMGDGGEKELGVIIDQTVQEYAPLARNVKELQNSDHRYIFVRCQEGQQPDVFDLDSAKEFATAIHHTRWDELPLFMIGVRSSSDIPPTCNPENGVFATMDVGFEEERQLTQSYFNFRKEFE
nr:toll/interleukin-1 receptor domain-containing protein [uncultured Desulfobacter sp.]